MSRKVETSELIDAEWTSDLISAADTTVLHISTSEHEPDCNANIQALDKRWIKFHIFII